MSFILSFGKYGGFYYRFGNSWRLCLGWIAVTILFQDVDELLDECSQAETHNFLMDDRGDCSICGEGYRNSNHVDWSK